MVLNKYKVNANDLGNINISTKGNNFFFTE